MMVWDVALGSGQARGGRARRPAIGSVQTEKGAEA